MIILNKNTREISSGYSFEKLDGTIFGGKSGYVNKKNDLFNNDSIDTYDEDSDYDNEVGINKVYCRISGVYNYDEHKHLNHKRE